MNALNAYNKLNANVAGLKKSSEKLSSGYRINRAGDDAAGLAISEKMRSQIRGLNQAVRNSQDGINMIQTFEGAAQETHSILQRMKELASESANGTYDNATDRAAIQLEFDQLNDELNQIADTDFNGTVVLNGGEMSDGLRAYDGEFDYAKNRQQSITDKMNEIDAEIKALKASKPSDLSTPANGFNTVDENKYGLDQAKELWENLGLNADTDEYIEVTFEASVDDETGAITYTAKSGSTDSGVALTEEQLTTYFTATSKDANDAGTATGKGGFVLEDAYNTNVILDASDVKTGDQIKLKFTGPGSSPKAPANAGVTDDSFTNGIKDANAKGIKAKAAADGSTSVPTVESKLVDDDMNADIKAILDQLNGAELSLDIAAGTTAGTDTDAVVNGGAITLKSGKSADLTTTNGGSKLTFTLDDGSTINLWAALSTDGKTLTLSTVNAGGTAKDKDLFTITLGEYTNNTTTAQTDAVKYNIAFDSYNAPSGANVDVSAESIPNLQDKELEAKISKLQAQYDALEDDITTGVSKSDAFENSTARMTYTDHIILQTGARTKDAVDFTFKYNTDETADMGELKANLNLSARADGLNTENLSLADQKSANYAIDQIDKAINKTSMVRASFGAIQNRLEHKITNLTTTSENLTEAESSIRDTDMASEMMNYTKFNILQQAAQSMLAQANQQPQSILQLLG